MVEVYLHVTEDEIVADRKEELEKLPERYGEDLDAIKERFLNEVGYREALHTSHIFAENVHGYLCEHPCVILDEKAYRLAHIAACALFDLYQRIGTLDYEASEKED